MKPPLRRLLPAAMLVVACASAPVDQSASARPIAEQPTATPAPSSSLSPSPTGSSPSPSAAGGSRIEGWQADLAALVPRLTDRHPRLDELVSIDTLQAEADRLAAAVPTLTDDELMVGVLRIVAMPSATGCDAHLGAFIWGTGTFPIDILPLRLWLFDDGVYIVDALPPYESLVGGRVERIEGQPTADVLAAIDPLVPRDNAQTVRLLLPRYVLIPQVLRGLGLADEGPISLSVRLADDLVVDSDVVPISRNDYNQWAGSYGLHLPADPDVRYLSRMDEPLWWEDIGGGTLYVQYNRVEFSTSATLDGLRAALHDPARQRVVVDIRHNYGGEVGAVEPMVGLFVDPAVDRPDRLFVITGRNTYSAASLFAARMDDRTGALFVGEPMGGCPTAWGNSRDFTLPFSGIAVSVPTIFEIGVSADDPRLTIEPDIAAPLTVEAWANHVDPALAAIGEVGP